MSLSIDKKSFQKAPEDFKPSWLLKNRHVQSLLASSKLRKPKIMRRAAGLLEAQREVLLSGGGDVRLHSLVSEHKKPDKLNERKPPLVILIHGWEGSAESIYLLSAASALFNAGFDVVRLNMRDHGPSHHLNAELFHGGRLDEVVHACGAINREFPRNNTSLVGFSLGGNFALRVATKAKENGLRLDRIVAVSPVVNPMSTMRSIEQGWAAYRTYFIKKWRTSLAKKQQAFPGSVDINGLMQNENLMSMTDSLIQCHTEFESVENYFNSYALIGDKLASIDVPTDIITAADDPVIPVADFALTQPSAAVQCRVLAAGGHCGFIKDLGFNSWIDEELLRLLAG